MATNTAANPAMHFPIGMNTGTNSPHTKRMFHPLEVGVGVGGSVWIYVFNNSGATISAGTVGVVRASISGTSTNTLVSGGTGFTIDKDVADQTWYFARSSEGGLGLQDAAYPTISFAAGATNKVRYTVTWKDSAGTTIAAPRAFRMFLSDSAAGAGLTSTAASGEIVAVTGSNIATITTHKEWSVEAAASGIFVGDLTDTAKTQGYYLCVVQPENGVVVVSSTATVTASYG